MGFAIAGTTPVSVWEGGERDVDRRLERVIAELFWGCDGKGGRYNLRSMYLV